MFVHLRLHSEFSVIDGTCRIDDVISSAASDQQAALASMTPWPLDAIKVRYPAADERTKENSFFLDCCEGLRLPMDVGPPSSFNR